MRIGTLCYATNSGLGILAKAFYDNGVVTDPLIVKHSVHENHFEWYPNAPIISNIRANEELYHYVKGLDSILFFETPFNWSLIDYCKSTSIKTVLMPMHECMPTIWPSKPDVIINPSLLDQDCFPRGIYTPVPVDILWKQRTVAKVFIHNAGHGGLKGRNGTKELLEAWEYVESNARLIIRSQSDIFKKANYRQHAQIVNPGRNLEIRIGTFSFEQLYSEGDVLIFPEHFNGLSLPLQEAYASGMLVMATDRHPMNKWLPTEPLIKASGYTANKIGPPYRTFEEARVDPRDIAAKIDEWYGRDITSFSELGRVWAGSMSWEKLKPRYLEVLSWVRERST